MSGYPVARCIGCGKEPHEFEEYVSLAAEEGMTAAAYVRLEEGTYNSENGHFLCDGCYIEAGMPSTPHGWIAP